MLTIATPTLPCHGYTYQASYRPVDQITALMYDPVRSQLLSASTSLRPWPMLKVAKRSVERGHIEPLCAALYNVNFHEVGPKPNPDPNSNPDPDH